MEFSLSDILLFIIVLFQIVKVSFLSLIVAKVLTKGVPTDFAMTESPDTERKVINTLYIKVRARVGEMSKKA